MTTETVELGTRTYLQFWNNRLNLLPADRLDRTIEEGLPGFVGSNPVRVEYMVDERGILPLRRRFAVVEKPQEFEVRKLHETLIEKYQRGRLETVTLDCLLYNNVLNMGGVFIEGRKQNFVAFPDERGRLYIAPSNVYDGVKDGGYRQFMETPELYHFVSIDSRGKAMVEPVHLRDLKTRRRLLRQLLRHYEGRDQPEDFVRRIIHGLSRFSGIGPESRFGRTGPESESEWLPGLDDWRNNI